MHGRAGLSSNSVRKYYRRNFKALELLAEVLGGLSYLGNCSFMFLHQLIHVLLILLHTRLQVIFLSLQTADLFLQL